MTYHSELSRNLVTFSEVSLLKIALECFDKGFFPDELKCAEVAPVYKKRIIITIDRSVFCLIYQNYMKGVCINNLVNIFDIFLSKFQCGFIKRFRAQHCLLVMLEKWKPEKQRQQRSFCSGSHWPLLSFWLHTSRFTNSKIKGFRFRYKSLISIRKQRTKVGSQGSTQLWCSTGVDFKTHFFYLLYLWQIYFLLTITLILPVM